MQINNGLVFCDDNKFRRESVYIENGIIAAHAGGEIVDASGCIVAPGFVDCHIHGALGHDFCEGTVEAFAALSAYLASVGVTSYLGTTMAMEKEHLRRVMSAASDYMDVEPSGAVMRGINLEGPFASPKKPGAMDPRAMIKPDVGLFCELDKLCGGRIVFADIAPELDGAMEFIEEISRTHRVSLHHTEADYDTAKLAFEKGARHVTHLYNAMSPFGHRAPGIVGAAMDLAEYVELIADGVHCHHSAVRAAFKMFGDDRICLISDAIMACSVPEGRYELGGFAVTVKNGAVTLDNGTLAGSAVPLSESFRRAVKDFGIPLESALKGSCGKSCKGNGDV